MASFLAAAIDAPRTLVVGDVLPIAHFPDADNTLAALGGGGALYLVARRRERAWLVAVLESPRRVLDGWSAAPNSAPITDLAPLGLTPGRLPRKLDRAAEAAIRALLGDDDEPVLAPIATAVAGAADGPPLVRATIHLARGHVEAAIAALLDAWRATRTTALADAIERATRLTRAHDRPLSDRLDRDAVGAAWQAAFDADRDAAMPQLLQNLAVGHGIGDRIARLGALPDDPRIARRLAAIALDLPFGDLRAMIPIVRRSGDRHAILALDACVPELVTRIGAIEPMPGLRAEPHVDVTAIDAALAAREAGDPERALVDAIGDHPDDDGPRRIYADWLIERAHPRGEYIALACEPKISGAKARRLAMLADVPFLFGDLDDVATTWRRSRDRGLDRELVIYASATPDKLAAAARHPLARVLDAVTFIGVPLVELGPALAAFARAAVRLQRLDNLPRPVATAVAAELDDFAARGDDVVRVTG